MLSDHHERRLGESAAELASLSGVEPLAVVCDVTDEDAVQALYQRSSTSTDGSTSSVNNAGLGGTAHLVDMTDDQWSSVLDVTLTGTFRCTRAVAQAHDPAGIRRHREQRVGDRLARRRPDRRTTRRPRPA